MTSTAHAITFRNVGKSFENGRIIAIDDLSLDVAARKFLDTLKSA